jgi:hypothetical protein
MKYVNHTKQTFVEANPQKKNSHLIGIPEPMLVKVMYLVIRKRVGLNFVFERTWIDVGIVGINFILRRFYIVCTSKNSRTLPPSLLRKSFGGRGGNLGLLPSSEGRSRVYALSVCIFIDWPPPMFPSGRWWLSNCG